MGSCTWDDGVKRQPREGQRKMELGCGRNNVNCVSAKGTRALLCCPCRAVGNATRAADFFICEFHSPHHFDVRTRVCNDRVALA